MRHGLAVVVCLLLAAGCGSDGDAAPAAAPSPTVDRYALYAELVDREAALTDPPQIKSGEAEELASRVCTSSQEAFQSYLTTAAGLSGSLNAAILDRRMFVIAYCDDRLPMFDAAAKQACADAVPIVGRNCPGRLSTLNSG